MRIFVRECRKPQKMSQPLKLNAARGRVTSYWLTGVLLTFILAKLHGNDWHGTADIHTHIEIIAAFLAAVVGLMALVRFYSKKDNKFLFIASGFLGAAFLDGYHAVVTSKYFSHSCLRTCRP